MDFDVFVLIFGLLAQHVDSVQRTYDEGISPSSPCAERTRERDMEGCLVAIRKRAEDPSVFWFGSSYRTTCGGGEGGGGGVEEGEGEGEGNEGIEGEDGEGGREDLGEEEGHNNTANNNTTTTNNITNNNHTANNTTTTTNTNSQKYIADCYNPRGQEEDSLVSRLFPSAHLDPDSLDRFLQVSFTTTPGKYEACENKYSVDYTREVTLDPLSMTVVSPFEMRDVPSISWPADEDETRMFTLVFYDVGYLTIKALYLNIPSNNFAEGEGAVQYEGPLNPTRNLNPYVFLLFAQSGPITLTDKWRKLISKRDWDTELPDFIDSHELEGPLAMSWVVARGDAYSAEANRKTGFMNTCAHFVSDAFKTHKIDFIPNKTYFGDPLQLSVFVNVTFEATPTFINSCCSIHSYPARTFNLNPLGNAVVLPAHARTDVTKYVTLHMATAFPDTQRDFGDKTLTVAMVDPDVPLQAYGNRRLPFLHWLLTNVRGGDVTSGHVVQGYMGPAPPDARPHRYYILVFLQHHDLQKDEMDFSAANCSWDFRGRCRYDISTMASQHNLTLAGVTWMTVAFDAFVRQIYVGAGLNPPCVACQGLPGYAHPCPPPGARSSSGVLQAGACRIFLLLMMVVMLKKDLLCA